MSPASDSDNLLSLGALLIENKISQSITTAHNGHFAKKLKSDNFSSNEAWALLAE